MEPLFISLGLLSEERGCGFMVPGASFSPHYWSVYLWHFAYLHFSPMTSIYQIQLLSQCQWHQKGTQSSLSWSRSPWCLVRNPPLSRPIFLTLQWRWGTRGLWFPDVSASYSSLKWWFYLSVLSFSFGSMGLNITLVETQDNLEVG